MDSPTPIFSSSVGIHIFGSFSFFPATHTELTSCRYPELLEEDDDDAVSSSSSSRCSGPDSPPRTTGGGGYVVPMRSPPLLLLLLLLLPKPSYTTTDLMQSPCPPTNTTPSSVLRGSLDRISRFFFFIIGINLFHFFF